jgi:gamma-glutamyltranspeptidase/glutathione hydrolase
MERPIRARTVKVTNREIEMEFLSNSQYISRRSPVFSHKGMAASSQYAATQIGVSLLDKGGNAADATLAMAAALQVTQACSTGLGGDAFVLYYHAAEKKVYALNGSGRSSRHSTLPAILEKKDEYHRFHGLTVTVPGAPAAWDDFHSRFGRLARTDCIQPAADLAREGFYLGALTSAWWKRGAEIQLSQYPHGKELCNGELLPGTLLKIPRLADSLETFALQGKEPFYTGAIAEKIVEAVQQAGGHLDAEDLAAHGSEWVEPISLDIQGVRVYECPPNGQGLAALIALNIMKYLPDTLHSRIEAMKAAFAEASYHVADPDFYKFDMDYLLSPEYGKKRVSEISSKKAGTFSYSPGLKSGNDTVYFNVVDAEGNGCSFINSNYMGFGTGIVPQGTGFSLQNRGFGFSLDPEHPNVWDGSKRPYHTIIPGLMTKNDEFYGVFGVMGGFMQPQGHMQTVLNLLNRNADPQYALDAARFQITDGQPDGIVQVEKSFGVEAIDELKSLGHQVQVIDDAQRSHFGLGQMIVKEEGRYIGGTESRGDGAVLAQL